MFYICNNSSELSKNLEAIGLKQEIINKKDILIKINLSRPYTKKSASNRYGTFEDGYKLYL